MNDEEHKAESAGSEPSAVKRELLPLPGLAAIAFYLLLLSVVVVIVENGGNYPPLFLALPVFLLAACGGLLMLFRWAWAMALSAVLLLGGYNLWLFARLHRPTRVSSSTYRNPGIGHHAHGRSSNRRVRTSGLFEPLLVGK